MKYMAGILLVGIIVFGFWSREERAINTSAYEVALLHQCINERYYEAMDLAMFKTNHVRFLKAFRLEVAANVEANPKIMRLVCQALKGN